MTDGSDTSIAQVARTDATLSENFIVLTVASSVIATFGLLENSVAVIIGAMIVAPLMNPIAAFAYGAVNGEARILRAALITSLVGAALAIGISGLLGLLIALPAYGSEVAARTRPTLSDLGIAIAAGAVAGFAKTRPSVASAIAGTAVAVALMPPLCVVGLSAADGRWSLAAGALLLFGTNFLGIALACMVLYVVGRQPGKRGWLAIVTTAAAAAALAVPLGASSYLLVRQARLEAQIRRELLTNTVTFRRVHLESAIFDWYAKPIKVNLAVTSALPITPGEVSDLQHFIARRTGTAVVLAVNVSRYESVKAP